MATARTARRRDETAAPHDVCVVVLGVRVAVSVCSLACAECVGVPSRASRSDAPVEQSHSQRRRTMGHSPVHMRAACKPLDDVAAIRSRVQLYSSE